MLLKIFVLTIRRRKFDFPIINIKSIYCYDYPEAKKVSSTGYSINSNIQTDRTYTLVYITSVCKDIKTRHKFYLTLANERFLRSRYALIPTASK